MGTTILPLSLVMNTSIAPREAQKADRVLIKANIETMNPKQPTAQAVAMKGGKIVFVGNNEEVKKHITGKTDIIDLDGKYVTPGLIESHNHVIAATWMTAGVDVSMATTPEELAQTMKDHADANPDLKVIIANGWTYSQLNDQPPKAKHLDAVCIDRPAIAIGNYCHDAALNSIALEKAGINNETAIDTQPGIIYWDRDENCDINGLAIEMQYAQAYVDCGAWDPETMVPESIEYLQGFLATQGVTTALTPGIGSPGVIISYEAMKNDMRDIMHIMQKRVESGQALMRNSVIPMFKTPDADPVDFVNFAVEMREQYDSDMLWTRSVKIHPEAAWQSRSSNQFEPYLPENEGDEPTWGEFGVTPDRIWEIVQRANAKGFDVVTHSDGARMNALLVDAHIHSVKMNPDARNRLDHIGFLSLETRAKVVKHNIGVNATPMFTNECDAGPGGKNLFSIVDKRYACETYGSYSDLAYEYDNVSLSGDHPGMPIERAYPLFLMQQAMTLVEPRIEGSKPFPTWRAKMTIDQVLAAYTRIPAWQMKIEDKIGSIEVGKYADFAIFEKSLREIKPENLIEEGKVVGTLLNGEFTHRDDTAL